MIWCDYPNLLGWFSSTWLQPSICLQFAFPPIVSKGSSAKLASLGSEKKSPLFAPGWLHGCIRKGAGKYCMTFDYHLYVLTWAMDSQSCWMFWRSSFFWIISFGTHLEFLLCMVELFKTPVNSGTCRLCCTNTSRTNHQLRSQSIFMVMRTCSFILLLSVSLS